MDYSIVFFAGLTPVSTGIAFFPMAHLSRDIPSGYVKIAIENCHLIKNGGSFHSSVSLPEGTGWGPQDS